MNFYTACGENLEKMNNMNVYIDQYIPRHSRISIYRDTGLQKHTTSKRTKLLKQPNNYTK